MNAVCPTSKLGAIVLSVILALPAADAQQQPPAAVPASPAAARDVVEGVLDLARQRNVTNIIIGKQIQIGISGRDTLLLALTLFLRVLTFGSGRTNIMTGLVHLIVFATFIFLVFVP